MMRQDEELWIKKMREVLKDYSEPSAPDGWSRLEKELVTVRKKSIRPNIWWAAAAALLLAISGVSLFFMQTPTAEDIRQTVPPAIAATPDVIPKTQEPDIQHAHLSDAANIGKSPRKTTKTISHDDIKQKEDEQCVEGFDTPSDTVKTTTEHVRQKADQQSGKQFNDRKAVKPSKKDKLHLPVVSGKERPSNGKWSVAALFSNGAAASMSQTQDYLMALPQSSYLPSEMVSIDNNSELVFESGVPYLRQSASITGIKHKQPISVGLSVRKNLSKGFSVETGLTYTMLSSEGKSVNNALEKIEQQFHYIGIPIRGNWTFVDSKRFMVYLTAGGMVEKCIYGEIGHEKETVKPLQFSLTGGVGGQLNITNRIGLYVEPGVSYFFDDGSDVETIRKEKPLNFNLQGGIRFTY